MSGAMITFRILRYRVGDPDSGRYEQSNLQVGKSTTVLEVLEDLSRRDRTLMFRRSCHHGSCGTCACRINGRERLACTTRVLELDTDVVTLEPLNKLQRIGDLVVDPADFFAEYPAEWRILRLSEANPEAQPPQELAAFVRLENCIECGACISACPVEDFLGPAVLAGINRERLNRMQADAAPDHAGPDKARLEPRGSRDGSSPETRNHERALLELAGGERGVWKCQRALHCSRVCPTAVYPARHIQELRNELS
jgi:succinate dehydrogenase / fumarate reductase iron-sulfur subunit